MYALQFGAKYQLNSGQLLSLSLPHPLGRNNNILFVNNASKINKFCKYGEEVTKIRIFSLIYAVLC